MNHKSTDPGEGSDDAPSTVSSTSASASLEHQNLLPTEFGTIMPSPNSAPDPVSTLPSSDTNPTPVQPHTNEAVLNTGNKKTPSANKDKDQPKMKADKEVQASVDGDEPFDADCEAYQKLFDQILTNVAQDDVIANSGLNLYHRVNECARDYMEAKQIVERRENEIAAVSAKIEAMQAIMDEASKHLQKAKAIATEAIDSSVAEQFRLKEEQNLTNILIDMTNAIAKGNCHTWPRQKVNKHLEDLQSVFYKNKQHCQSPMVSSGIVYVAKHFIFHADYDDAFEPMLFHLANQTDYMAFVGRSRKNDHEFAKQHQGVYTNRPGAGLTPKTSTTAAPLGDEAPVDKGPDGPAGAAQAKYHDSEQAPSQKLTSLPPRSSSLPSASHTYKHFDFKPDADMNKVADKIRSQLESQPGLTSGTMKAAVLESIAGLEVIFKDGTNGAPPNVRKDATAVFEDIERLNKDFLMSDQVTRKLAETQGFRCIQTHELPGGRIQIDVTAAGCYEGCGCRPAKRDHLESSGAHGNSAALHEDMMASSGNSDQLWKNHHVSGPAPGNC